MKAIWKDTVIAESDQTVVVDGNHCFPRTSIKDEHFRESTHHTLCGWKGTASYYDVVVDRNVNANAAWYYPETYEAANNIKDYIAFWNGVSVTE